MDEGLAGESMTESLDRLADAAERAATALERIAITLNRPGERDGGAGGADDG